MKEYTIGIMGLGKIAESFAKAVNTTEGARLVCASRTESRAKSFAEKYDAVRYYGSYKELACDSEVDLIYIATPMSCHYEDVKLCLNGGRNVLCEKSVTINARQWDDLTALASEKGLFLMEAMWMKCLPSFRKVKQWISDGRIGKPIAIKADFNNLCRYDENDRLFRKDLGGGALLDLGVYVLTFACDILGYNPDSITSGIKIGISGADFHDSVMLRYSDGSFAELTSSFDFLSENKAYVLGTEGKIMIGPWFHCAEYAELFDNHSNIIDTYDEKFICNGYEYELAEAIDCLEKGLKQSPLVPHSETASIMKIMDGIRREHGFSYENTPYENE